MSVELPIFELPLVLLPGELLPLHIFEERYKRMIGALPRERRAVRDRLSRRRRRARRIGCAARVTEVPERFDDGRLNIVVTGERPFRVLDRFEATEYPAGEVEPIDPPPRSRRGGGGAAATAREAFARAGPAGRRRAARGRRARDLRLLRDRRPGRAAGRDQAAPARAALRAGADADPGRRRSARSSTPSPLAGDRRAGEDQRQASIIGDL